MTKLSLVPLVFFVSAANANLSDRCGSMSAEIPKRFETCLDVNDGFERQECFAAIPKQLGPARMKDCALTYEKARSLAGIEEFKRYMSQESAIMNLYALEVSCGEGANKVAQGIYQHCLAMKNEKDSSACFMMSKKRVASCRNTMCDLEDDWAKKYAAKFSGSQISPFDSTKKCQAATHAKTYPKSNQAGKSASDSKANEKPTATATIIEKED